MVNDNLERRDLVHALDELGDDPEAANLRGFLVRVPESKFYRPPPRGCPQDVPTVREMESRLWWGRWDANERKRRASR